MTTLATKAAAAAKAQWARQPQPSVCIDLPFPPSVNHIWKHGGKGKGYRSERYVRWSRVAGLMLNAQRPGKIDGPYRIRIVLGKPDGRRRDLDNFVKAPHDLLVEHHIIDDDSLALSITLAWSDRIEGCRVLLKAVNPLSHRQPAQVAA